MQIGNIVGSYVTYDFISRIAAADFSRSQKQSSTP